MSERGSGHLGCCVRSGARVRVGEVAVVEEPREGPGGRVWLRQDLSRRSGAQQRIRYGVVVPSCPVVPPTMAHLQWPSIALFLAFQGRPSGRGPTRWVVQQAQFNPVRGGGDPVGAVVHSCVFGACNRQCLRSLLRSNS